jgi:molybdopterin converting factor small subunit
MRVRIKLYGFLTIGVNDADHSVELTLPQGTDVEGMIESLGKTSPMFDPRSCFAMIDGGKVPLDRTLAEGDEVHLYPIFSGG